MNPSENCLKVIRHYESLRSIAYKCPAGVWTYGYGFTKKPDGFPVGKGDTITKEQAEGYLSALVLKFAVEIRNTIPSTILEQHQLDALTSFVFNIGLTKFQNSSLYRVLKSGKVNDPDIDKLFLRWVYGGGVPLRGLVKRRMTESHLYLTGEVVLDWPMEAVEMVMNRATR